MKITDANETQTVKTVCIIVKINQMRLDATNSNAANSESGTTLGVEAAAEAVVAAHVQHQKRPRAEQRQHHWARVAGRRCACVTLEAGERGGRRQKMKKRDQDPKNQKEARQRRGVEEEAETMMKRN